MNPQFTQLFLMVVHPPAQKHASFCPRSGDPTDVAVAPANGERHLAGRCDVDGQGTPGAAMCEG